MKTIKIIVIALLFSLIACKKTDKNQIPKTKNLMGIISLTELKQEPFKEWYSEHYNETVINNNIIDSLKPIINSTNIKVILGTWCHDSQVQTPAFIKVLEQSNFDFSKLEMIAVDENKKTTENLENGLNIERVPTVIFYKNGNEINRIIETPVISFEKDILSILTKNDYTPNLFTK